MSIIKGKTNTVAGVGKNGTGFTLFTPIWQDHLVNNASWLRADTFSWQSGAVYVAAYNHLKNDADSLWRQEYGWSNTDNTYVYWTTTTSPTVGNPIYGYDPHQKCGVITAVSGNTITINDTVGNRTDTLTRNTNTDTIAVAYEKEVVSGTTIYCLRAADGHKIVLPYHENTVMDIYNATGIAWYYILDTTNQRFKLPRNKYGFTGFRDNVGNYVAPGLPNITSGKANILAYKQDGVSSYTEGSITANYDVHGGLINNSGNWMWSGTARLNANIENPIYGASDTVQPPAVQTYLYFFVGNTVEEVTTINVGQLTESLNGKADTSLANLSTAGKSLASGLGMPSNRYIDLELGASHTNYTAPANGYVFFSKVANATGQWIQIVTPFYYNQIVSSVAQPLNFVQPVLKNTSFRINYTAEGTTEKFRFIYAEGAE